ncbi:ubiquitin carboxyl-terminal hydrolase 50 [Anabrus simplex]|uniref:ubiquitin carboxyl-terminal hydrolase 50 n=1 Tax=Anabrus simplex TaxID=316456 RepID=UPI0035A30187
MNSIVQLLLRIKEFTGKLLENETKLEDSPIGQNLLSVVKQCASGSTAELYNSLRELKLNLGHLDPNFASDRQNDIEEFLLKLLEHLESFCKGLKDIFTFTILRKYTCSRCGDYDFKDEKECILYVNIDSGSCGLQKAIQTIFSGDDVRKHCVTCKWPKCSLVTVLHQIPRVLIIVAKRYAYSQDLGAVKNTECLIPSKFIKLDRVPEVKLLHKPKNILVNRFPQQVSPTLKTAQVKYELKGIISHTGETTNSGHYTANVLDSSSGCWYHCNDMHIKRTKLDDVRLEVARDGYMFFYNLSFFNRS